ncbi:MAG: molybdenum cofactor biosynthesis protein A [Syntrophaceae bacterium PtaU1.Bin231]|nr:MAG: molybdenum cofactor biosynthesis protein A [Syntrophaceae bacterium PtaU1.Bin231]
MDIAEQLCILQNTTSHTPFYQKVLDDRQLPLTAYAVEILQMNVGRSCNLNCKHCHVEAGRARTEVMGREVMEACLDVLAGNDIPTIDITGGAPELNPDLAWFIAAAAPLKRRLIVRSNLVVLHDERYTRYIDIFAEHGVEIVASLPDYNGARTDRQRGTGTFDKSIAILKILNQKGYGAPDGRLALNLVHNPVGAYLPGNEQALEHEYRTRLGGDHGIVFNSLFSLTNIPIGRYLEYLVRSGNYEDYINDLCTNFNPSAVDRAMCRNTVSVAWDGTLYDCDFNQMLDLKISRGNPGHIRRFDIDKLSTREITVNNHCYGCTAGAGSSCQGCTIN